MDPAGTADLSGHTARPARPVARLPGRKASPRVATPSDTVQNILTPSQTQNVPPVTCLDFNFGTTATPSTFVFGSMLSALPVVPAKATTVGQAAASTMIDPAMTIKVFRMRSSDQLILPTKAQAYSNAYTVLSSIGETSSDSMGLGHYDRLILALNGVNSCGTWNDTQKPGVVHWAAKSNTLQHHLTLALRYVRVDRLGGRYEAMSFRGTYLGILAFLTTAAVLDAGEEYRRGVYRIAHDNLSKILGVVKENCRKCVAVGSFTSPPDDHVRAVRIGSGAQVFSLVAKFLTEFINIFPVATHSRPELKEFVTFFQRLFSQWTAKVGKDDSIEKLALEDKVAILDVIKADLARLVNAIVPHEEVIKHVDAMSAAVVEYNLSYPYRRPGSLRPQGRRHDNDSEHYRNIGLVPTGSEVASRSQPYVPSTDAAADHHMPAGSVNKLMDIQFRLLRENGLSSLIRGTKCLLDELETSGWDAADSAITHHGGTYRAEPEQCESIDISLLANAQYIGVRLDRSFGLIVNVLVNAPPGPASSPSTFVRTRYFEQGGALSYGGLVAVVTCSDDDKPNVCLALLASFPDAIGYTPRRPGTDKPGLVFGLSFVDPAEGIAAARSISNPGNKKRMIIESPELWEAYRSFLDGLQKISSANLPFGQYLARSDLNGCKVDMPAYARAVGFRWDLSSLLKPEIGNATCHFDPSSQDSIDNARRMLRFHGKVDPSQAEAVINSLTREVALMQGPPGTGKTFTGIEMLRVLLRNDVGPVLMLAFTNHALDHVLRGVLDNHITSSLVRLGSRSQDPIVKRYTLSELELKSKNKKGSNVKKRLSELERRMNEISNKAAPEWPTDEQVLNYLARYQPELRGQIMEPPAIAYAIFKDLHTTQPDGFQRVIADRDVKSTWCFWLRGLDWRHIERLDSVTEVKEEKLLETFNRFDNLKLDENEPPLIMEESKSTSDPLYDFMFKEPSLPVNRRHTPTNADSDDLEEEGETGQTTPADRVLTTSDILWDKQLFLKHFGFSTLPVLPTSDRPVVQLSTSDDVWTFSTAERKRYAEHIAVQAKSYMCNQSLAEVKELSEQYETLRVKYQKGVLSNRKSLLRGKQLLGATTTGSVKQPDLIKAFAPKVLVIEEAGQVLEAHILANLFPSIEHVIAIGDPLQLRPIISRYDLSVDSAKGKELYRFDVSLMERLSVAGMPMSQLQIQRRMRPDISSLIKNTLYPKLQDHEVVKQYPNVSGMSKNVFFLDHRQRESKDSKEGRQSKNNRYEVDMACELALHLLKQGCYNESGDIVILCAYAGQLRKLEKAMEGRVRVVIGEREQRELTRHGGDYGGVSETRMPSLHGQIHLRTIDNFQGEEAKCVILSFVRNAGELDDYSGSKGSIGFLSTNNRVNVALSRAKHGMYIMGNAPQLAARSPMWNTIVEELRHKEAIGDGWPVGCARHPANCFPASKPGDIVEKSPEGGCQLDCDIKLSCGHDCTRKCHPDDLKHERARCEEACARKRICGHECHRRCFQGCGRCEELVGEITLPCGHVQEVTCWQKANSEEVKCKTRILGLYTTCEHSAMIPCGESVVDHPCRSPCGKHRTCCETPCNAPCSECQDFTSLFASASQAQAGLPSREHHTYHKCPVVNPVCGHECEAACATDHRHDQCDKRCLHQCTHARCHKGCSDACSPCEQPCNWSCPHAKCTLPCAMPCDRLPCDEPCAELLRCGHPCSSVCGEPCQYQLCLTCADADQLATPVDITGDVLLSKLLKEEPEAKLVSLGCGHTFSISALDAHVGLAEWYTRDTSGQWDGLAAPPAGFAPRPTCPTCSSTIDSPRYNRIVKKALWDLRQRHAISTFARLSDQAREVLGRAQDIPSTSALERLLSASAPDLSTRMPNQELLDSTLRVTPGEETVYPPAILAERLSTHFAITGTLRRTWIDHAQSLLEVYKRISDELEIGTKTPSAVLTDVAKGLIREELSGMRRFGQIKDSVKQEARAKAHHRLGLSQQAFDVQFKVEAIVQTIMIRLKLSKLAGAFAEALETTPAVGSTRSETKLFGEANHASSRRFGILAWVIIRSCVRDLDISANLARRGGLIKWAIIVELMVIAVKYELVKIVHAKRVRAFATEHGVGEQSALIAEAEAAGAKGRFEGAMRSVKALARDDAQGREVEVRVREAHDVTQGMLQVWQGMADAFRAEGEAELQEIEVSQIMQDDSGVTGLLRDATTCMNGHLTSSTTRTCAECFVTLATQPAMPGGMPCVVKQEPADGNCVSA